MWKDIMMSIGTAVMEALGATYLEKKEQKKVVNALKVAVDEGIKEFEDTSLDCADFHMFVKSQRFMEMMRNLFMTIEDGKNRDLYINSIEEYVKKECIRIDTIELRRFINSNR